MQSENPRALIIGGGIVGSAVAAALVRHGVAVTILDPESDPPPASYGNAGHVAVEQVEPLASRAMIRGLPARLFSRGGPVGLPIRQTAAWLPFALRLAAASRPARFERGKAALKALMAEALPAWRRLLGGTGLMAETGHFVVWESAGSAAAGRAAWERADIGTARFRAISAKEQADLQSHVAARIAGGIRFDGTAHMLDLVALPAFLGRGVERRRAAVRALGRGGSVILDDGSRLLADRVIVACGTGSKALLEPIGHHVPIIAERGYHLQASESRWPIGLPPVVFEDRAMIVTRFRQGLRAVSFVEFARAEAPADPRKWARLESHAAALGLPMEGEVSRWMGARPTLPDYLPAIGRSPYADNLYYAFGHQHLGLTLAAVTGEAVAALVSGAEPVVDVAPFSLSRFERT